MKKIMLFTLVLMLAFSSLSVLAAGDELTAVFDSDKRAVKILGTVSSEGNALATVAIVKHGSDTVFSKENVPDIFYMYTLDDTGSINVEIPFSEKLLSGRYDILINGSFGEKQLYVILKACSIGE